MTKPEVQTGALFRGEEETPFTCGPFPLRDKSTGAVCWRIPPPAMQEKVTILELDLSWMKDSDGSEFKARWGRRMKALGAFRFM
ncbi:hypothetical protein FRC11_001024 [Ceratobasidium sp. 423]|nr:hypothetical protein FRC11_001024 [Ceratobasidium sp. 423]